MAGNSVSPMEDVHSASDKVESENDEPVASQPPALAQPKPQRPTGRSDLLSPCIPTTPTHTPALSNDVPVGPVSSKRLIQGLQEIQNHTEGGVVVQSRFGTPTEQQAEATRERTTLSKELVRKWDDGGFQGDGTGDVPSDEEMRDIPGEEVSEDAAASMSDGRSTKRPDNGVKATAAAGGVSRKEKEDIDRRDSAWKSRQSSLATPQDHPEDK